MVWPDCEHVSEQKANCRRSMKIHWYHKELATMGRKMLLAAHLARARGIFRPQWEVIGLWITGGARKVPMQALRHKGPRGSSWKD